MKKVIIVGAGLAGSEAAWQAAKQGAGVMLTMLIVWGFVLAVGAVYFALLASVLTTPVFLALVLALLAALYALTQHWLATRGVRRFESIR